MEAGKESILELVDRNDSKSTRIGPVMLPVKPEMQITVSHLNMGGIAGILHHTRPFLIKGRVFLCCEKIESIRKWGKCYLHHISHTHKR